MAAIAQVASKVAAKSTAIHSEGGIDNGKVTKRQFSDGIDTRCGGVTSRQTSCCPDEVMRLLLRQYSD